MTDVAGLHGGEQSCCLQVLGHFAVAGGMTSRTWGWRGGSQCRTPTGRKVAKGVIRESVQFPALCIPLELLVPRVGVELLEPRPELAQIRLGKMSYGFFNFLYCCHFVILPKSPCAEQDQFSFSRVRTLGVTRFRKTRSRRFLKSSERRCSPCSPLLWLDHEA